MTNSSKIRKRDSASSAVNSIRTELVSAEVTAISQQALYEYRVGFGGKLKTAGVDCGKNVIDYLGVIGEWPLRVDLNRAQQLESSGLLGSRVSGRPFLEYAEDSRTKAPEPINADSTKIQALTKLKESVESLEKAIEARTTEVK